MKLISICKNEKAKGRQSSGGTEMPIIIQRFFFFLNHLVKLRHRGDETGFSNIRSSWCLWRYLLL